MAALKKKKAAKAPAKSKRRVEIYVSVRHINGVHVDAKNHASEDPKEIKKFIDKYYG